MEIAATIALSSLLKCISIAGIAALWPTTLLSLVHLIASSFHLLAIARLDLGILFDHVDHFVWDAQVFDGTAANVALRHTPKFVTVLPMTKCDVKNSIYAKMSRTNLWCADDFAQIDVHPCVATDQMSIVCFTVLQFNQLKSIRSINRETNANVVIKNIDTYHWMALGRFQ